MKPEQFSDALGQIGDQHPAEALQDGGRRRRPIRRWAAAAAAVAAAAALAAAILPRGRQGTAVTVGGVERTYREVSVTAQETARLWPWEALSPMERYGTAVLNGVEFSARGAAADESLLGADLGACEAAGTDGTTGQRHTLATRARAVAGVDPSRLIAVELEGTWSLFLAAEYDPPATLGALLDAFSMADTLPLSAYTVLSDGQDGESRRLTDDGPLWELLSACADAPFREQADGGSGQSLDFTATSEALGVYKRVFTVTAAGLVQTNVFDYGFTYDIGPEAAAEILSFPAGNSRPADPEPYLQTVAGTVTAVTGGYLLVDDGVLCDDPAEAMVFRIPAGDIRIRRWIDSGQVKAGDLVVVDFTGSVDTADGNTVSGVRDLHPAVLSDGAAAVPE